MFPLYEDIRKRLGAPLWIDKHGVPRYDEYEPGQQGIYDNWDALFLVRCQACGKLFRCANSVSIMDVVRHNLGDKAKMELDIEKYYAPNGGLEWILGWGDAPWHDADGDPCGFDSQCSGTTMSTGITRIVGIYRRATLGNWEKLDFTAELVAPFLEEE